MSLRALLLFIFVAGNLASPAATNSFESPFQKGVEQYKAGAFDQAATTFRQAVAAAPSAGGLHNLGNAEWECGRAGAAILAWERAVSLDPFSAGTRTNLLFARKARQLDSPEFSWYETCSTWLSANTWAWIACASFWLSVAIILLPGIFRFRKAGWHQGVAAAGFGIFLLTIPALAGIQSRAKIGIIMAQDTPLRLTPTSQAQVLLRLPGGDVARIERVRGNYVYIRNTTVAGWIERRQLGMITSLE